MFGLDKVAARIVAILAVLALLALLLTLHECSVAGTATTQTKLSEGQTGAALDSGHDAVGTIGNRMEADAVGDQLTKENDDDIRKADGASAPIASGVRDAGLASLCRRPAYRSDPKCVQHAGSR